MQDTKVQFSEKELKLLSNAEIFHIKDQVWDKLFDLFEDLRAGIKETKVHQNFPFPDSVDTVSGRISQGENYRSLPWMVLDFPKFFSRQSIFAFRSMFWWGHFFSFTLQLHGKALENYRPFLKKNIQELAGQSYYICVNNTPWNHTFEKGNYRKLNNIGKERIESICREKDFIKIARPLPISQWEHVCDYGVQTYKNMIKLLY